LVACFHNRLGFAKPAAPGRAALLEHILDSYATTCRHDSRRNAGRTRATGRLHSVTRRPASTATTSPMYHLPNRFCGAPLRVIRDSHAGRSAGSVVPVYQCWTSFRWTGTCATHARTLPTPLHRTPHYAHFLTTRALRVTAPTHCHAPRLFAHHHTHTHTHTHCTPRTHAHHHLHTLPHTALHAYAFATHTPHVAAHPLPTPLPRAAELFCSILACSPPANNRALPYYLRPAFTRAARGTPTTRVLGAACERLDAARFAA